MNDKIFEVDGTVIGAHQGMKFLVEIEVGEKKRNILCNLSGKMKIHYIKIVLGDRVMLEVKSCDPTKGRIIYRYK